MSDRNPRLAEGANPSRATRCDFCRQSLSLGEEFVYQVESLEFVSHPILLEILRRIPSYHGEPLRLCGHCRASIEKNAEEIREEVHAQARDHAIAWALVRYCIVYPLAILLAALSVLSLVQAIR